MHLTRIRYVGAAGGFLAAHVLLLAGLAGCASTSPIQPPPLRSPVGAVAPQRELRPERLIIVDAGHGGHDPGTSHFGLKEKQLTLDIAKRLRTLLKDSGTNVVMTRDTDQFIPLSGRPAIANRLGADLFVSVHINANRNRGVSGIEVYYPRESIVSGSAQWPPSVRSSEVAEPSTTVKQVLWDLALGHTRTHSKRLGAEVCQALRQELQQPCRGVKAARFVVLRESWMPAILVEVGYVSNRAEAKRLATPAYRQAAAEGIAQGIAEYVRDLDARGM